MSNFLKQIQMAGRLFGKNAKRVVGLHWQFTGENSVVKILFNDEKAIGLLMPIKTQKVN